MPKAPPRFSRPEAGPALLPDDLLPQLIRRQPVLLCLDYDGTLSEIAPEPSLARPVNGVLAELGALAQYRDRVMVAIVTGRALDDLRSLLAAPPGIALAGVHGLELLDWNGRSAPSPRVDECRPDLERVRAWIASEVPAGAGFVVEDKGIALALHYRGVGEPAARRVREAFERFIRDCTGSLKLRPGKMVIEAIPRFATKAAAVRMLRERAGPTFAPVYFGDDLTDEDAFAEIGQAGISVLVGEPRASAARYRVDGPADVVRALESIAAILRDGTAEGPRN
ncbi:MAG TPA: trehalose-phosphatase [Candidatus Binataceae bacterium]|nr:trehalose-phosphatase [Candidatus Binataceae bacterium]